MTSKRPHSSPIQNFQPWEHTLLNLTFKPPQIRRNIFRLYPKHSLAQHNFFHVLSMNFVCMNGSYSPNTCRTTSLSAKSSSKSSRKLAKDSRKANQSKKKKNPITKTTESSNNKKINNSNNAKSSDYNSPLYKEINRMFILSFWDIFNHEKFNAKFNFRNFDRVKVLIWIRQYTIEPPRRIIQQVSQKAEDRSKPVEYSTVNYKKDNVLN